MQLRLPLSIFQYFPLRLSMQLHPRAKSMLALTLVLIFTFAALRDVNWQGGKELHTVMETAATLLAMFVGIIALIRYYSKKEITILFIGTGFLGASFLDGYHAIVTSSYFAQNFPSTLPSLIPWSWVASRAFLSIFLLLSAVTCYTMRRKIEVNKTTENMVYGFTIIFTLISFIFFAFTPLPRAYFDELFFHRPEEFIPAFLFLVTLVIYLKKGKWRDNTTEYWLILSLITGVLGQALFMSLSGHIFDTMFDLAHMLKKVSYIFVLTGLLGSMLVLFKKSEQNNTIIKNNEKRVRAIINTVMESIITIDKNGIILEFNPAAETTFNYKDDEVIGKSINILVPDDMKGKHDQYINHFIETGDAKIIGAERQTIARKQDGSLFPIMLTISELKLNGQLLFVGVIRDISKQLKADEIKDNFISVVSHELRTPLTSILGSLTLVNSGKLGTLNEKLSTVIDIATRNSKHLLMLINDILDVEKISSGKMEFVFKNINIMTLINDAIENNQSYADKYQVRFKITNHTNDTFIHADIGRMMQVMANLLSNAAKYSPKNETITIDISIADKEETVRVSVSDKGSGIPEEFRDKVFERFTQSNSSTTREVGGTGLGLNIAKSIIEKHQGSVDFHTKENHGTTFYFDLPITKAT